MNPFKEKYIPLEETICSLKSLYPKALDKNNISPYTKARIILMNGAEYEANWFSHCYNRNTDNLELRQTLSLMRFGEKEEQQRLNMLKPIDESILEQTIGYEQLAVDLTAFLAKNEQDFNVKKSLDFALLEDFDHLYRYSNLLETDEGIRAENLVGKYTEIMPGRPTIAHHRHPMDNPKNSINSKKSATGTVLSTLTITAAEQQTMNYYMNASSFYKNDEGRRLFQEICLVEEEHVTQYGSLIDPNGTFLEGLLWREFNECYLYWSCYLSEEDKEVKKIWEKHFNIELSHLNSAKELLKKFEHKDYSDVIIDSEFPEPIVLKENIEYVRTILNTTVQFTGKESDYENIQNLPNDDRFFTHQKHFKSPVNDMPSHKVIDNSIKEFKNDYRFETKENPIEELRVRTEDNVNVGSKPLDINSTGFKSN